MVVFGIDTLTSLIYLRGMELRSHYFVPFAMCKNDEFFCVEGRIRHHPFCWLIFLVTSEFFADCILKNIEQTFFCVCENKIHILHFYYENVIAISWIYIIISMNISSKTILSQSVKVEWAKSLVGNHLENWQTLYPSGV